VDEKPVDDPGRERRGDPGGQFAPGQAIPSVVVNAGPPRPRAIISLRGWAAGCWVAGIALSASVAASQTLLAIAGMAALGLAAGGGLRLRSRPTDLPLLLFAGWTLVSALAAADAVAALWKSKEVLLLAVPALGACLLRGCKEVERACAIVLGCGAALALWGIGEYARGLPNPYERMRGPLSHHLSFAGLILTLFLAAAAGCASRSALLRRASLASLAPLGAALLLNQSRSAWLGAAAGLLALALRGPRRPAIALICVAAAAVALHPDLRQRALSPLADREDTSLRARAAMRRTGERMIAESPWTGTGPGGVPAAYARLQPPDYPLPLVQHLHSNALQIAAERGLPAVALWAAFWVALGVALSRPSATSVAAARPEIGAAALAAAAAFLAMGLFEYNFGDAEPSTLLLGVLGLPFVAAETDGDDDVPGAGGGPAPRLGRRG
jgi:O-antigen ligase